MMNKAKEIDDDARLEAPRLENVGNGISQVWLTAMIIMTALIGIWGFVALISGIVGSENMLAVLKGYLAAITGSYL